MCASKGGLTFNQSAFRTYYEPLFTGTLGMGTAYLSAVGAAAVFALRSPPARPSAVFTLYGFL